VFLTNNKIIALILIIIVLLVAGAFALTYKAPTTVNNNTTVNNVTANSSNATADIKILANQTGPATAKKGDNVTINWTISNKGSQTAYNVKGTAQNFDTTVGTLTPGETKSYQYTIHIPTDAEVQQDFGPNATVSNPFFIGGFSVSYTNSDGSTHAITSNSIEINLV